MNVHCAAIVSARYLELFRRRENTEMTSVSPGRMCTSRVPQARLCLNPGEGLVGDAGPLSAVTCPQAITQVWKPLEISGR